MPICLPPRLVQASFTKDLLALEDFRCNHRVRLMDPVVYVEDNTQPDLDLEAQPVQESYYRGDTTFVNIYAKVKVVVDGTVQEICSRGCPQVSSQVPPKQLNDIYDKEVAQLARQLRLLAGGLGLALHQETVNLDGASP